ncbi:hypothetical protein [Lolliginicoccus levis]|uniref:hypothetical protein n=1 Tax=Lolliginicoccus levis TaxID=2919542 RepID=UPI00241F7BFA|nr:hypothetical protein [Lolliginicoccus levis]
MSSADAGTGRCIQLARIAPHSVAGTELTAARLEEALLLHPPCKHGTPPASARVLTSRSGPDLWLVVRGHRDLQDTVDSLLATAAVTDLVDWRWSGNEAPGIAGPAAGASPAVAAVAVRHLRDPESASTVLALLQRTGAEWKQTFPGFVAATPFLGADGVTLVNYPRWASVASYDAWMAEPRMRSGQKEVGEHEIAAPEYHVLDVHAYRLLA